MSFKIPLGSAKLQPETRKLGHFTWVPLGVLSQVSGRPNAEAAAWQNLRSQGASEVGRVERKTWKKMAEKIVTPSKINIEPENDGLEEYFPFQTGDFQVPC